MRCFLSLSVLFFAHALFAAPARQSCTVKDSPALRPAITGVAFVAFYVSDAAAAERFYHGELGLSPLAGKGESKLYPINHEQWIETRPSGSTVRNDRQAAIGLLTPDIKAMQQYLIAKGYGSNQGFMSNGQCEPVALNGQFTVQDPEGNTIVFVQAGSQTQIAHGTLSSRAISRRIIHTGFVVQDQDKENAFYRGILGFTPYWHGGMKENLTDWVSQQVPDGTDWLEYMLNVKPDASAQVRGVMNHVSLGVPKVSEAVAQLQGNGCDTKECNSSQMGRDGKVQLNLYDPNHSRIEVMDFTPSGPTCCSTYQGRMPSAGDTP